MRWQLCVALPVVAAAAVCTSVRRAEGPARTSVPSLAQQPTVHAADFDSTVKPIVEKHCRPCHFTGGVMYDKLPFDRAETIRELGEKLFTRIKDLDERAAIRKFLARQP
jgi:cytochrome c5